MSLYQISEPLQAISSATASNATPFGTDFNNAPLNDPIPDTLINPITGQVVSDAAVGKPALLDAFTITKPKIAEDLKIKLSAPSAVKAGSVLSYKLSVSNDTDYPLNGTQAVLLLPENAIYVGKLDDTIVKVGNSIIVTLGRLESEEIRNIKVEVKVPDESSEDSKLVASAMIRSATAMPVSSNKVITGITD
jgi:hypothetical protein